MEPRRWRVTASSYVIDSHFLRLRRDTIELPDGTVVDDYYVRESRGFVVVFAQTATGEVVLVRQYKHGIGKRILELPAGAIDPGESPLEAARRELREETAYDAQRISFVRSFITDPTNSDSAAHLFYAPDAYVDGSQRLDATEDITVELASLRELHEMISDGRIDCMPHVAAIYVMLERLGNLRAET